MENNNKKTDINNMTLLCHVVDNFDEFEEGLISLISLKNNIDFIFKGVIICLCHQ